MMSGLGMGVSTGFNLGMMIVGSKIPSDSSFMNDAGIQLASGLTKDEHYNRNSNQDEKAPESLDDLKSNEKYQTDGKFDQNKFDNFWQKEKNPYCYNLNGDTDNSSFRYIGDGSDGYSTGFQYVFDNREPCKPSIFRLGGLFCQFFCPVRFAVFAG